MRCNSLVKQCEMCNAFPRAITLCNELLHLMRDPLQPDPLSMTQSTIVMIDNNVMFNDTSNNVNTHTSNTIDSSSSSTTTTTNNHDTVMYD